MGGLRFIEPQTTLEAHTSRRAPSGQTQGPRRAREGSRFPGLEALPPAAPARSMDWQKWGRGRPGRRPDAGEQTSRASRLKAARSKTPKTGSDSSRPRPCRRHNSSQPPRDRHDERGLDRARLRGRAPGAPNAGSTGPASRPGAGSTPRARGVRFGLRALTETDGWPIGLARPSRRNFYVSDLWLELGAERFSGDDAQNESQTTRAARVGGMRKRH